MIRIALLALLAGPAMAEPPAAVQTMLDYHAAACAAQGGALEVPQDAVSQAFLFGPEDPAHLLDSRRLTCSTAPAMFCGDGVGCELNVFVGPAQHSLVVLDWSLIPDDDRQLLEVTIAAELLNRPQDLTTRMTWDSSAAALVTVD
jgi:hypothetical protein